MHTHTDYPPSRPGPAEDGAGAGSSTRTARLADRFATLPFRQLAGRRTFLVAAKTRATASDGRPCARWSWGNAEMRTSPRLRERQLGRGCRPRDRQAAHRGRPRLPGKRHSRDRPGKRGLSLIPAISGAVFHMARGFPDASTPGHAAWVAGGPCTTRDPARPPRSPAP